MRKSLFTLVPLLFLVSCDQEPAAPTLQAVHPTPAFGFSNGPATPGNSYIVRGEYGDFFWVAIDPQTELAVWVTDDDFECADFEGATLVPFQQVFNPSADPSLLMYHEAGLLNALIVEPPYGCDDVLATGLVHNTWTDNDVLAWLNEHNRANPYGGVINGRVGHYTVSWVIRLRWGGLTKPDYPARADEKITVK